MKPDIFIMTYQCSQCGQMSKVANYFKYNKKLTVARCRFCQDKTIMTILNQEKNKEIH
jgi:transcription elongation factor Elf1